MSKRTKADPKAWRQTEEGWRKYRATRAEAQALCNADGFDRGVEFNDLLKTVRHFMLPNAVNRYGHELCCEVVMCEIHERTQPGYGSAGRLALRDRDRGTELHYKSSTGR